MNIVRGHHQFHENPSINFQLNRLVPGADLQELQSASSLILGLSSWKAEMLALAERAEATARYFHASTYYRAAEFYMLPDDPDKKPANRKFLSLFDVATADLPLERIEIPYEQGALPAIRLAAVGPRRDVLVVHGGFDSYIEELLLSYLDFPDAGIEVVLFDGPGQGQALRCYGLTMAPEWEKPVAAVLDHLGVQRCTLMGWSLGGYLAPRAAAFEPRIKRVIANDVLADFLDCFSANSAGADAVKVIEGLLQQQRFDDLDAIAARLMAGDEIVNWVIRHGMAVCGAQTPAGFFGWLSRIQTAPFAHRITQDFLLMAAAEDHIVPRHQFYRQIEDLSSVASLTAQLFTHVDAAQSHCHVGNLSLISRYVRRWLDFQLECEQERQASSGAGDGMRPALPAAG